ncbi:MAG: hypothetical protein HY865_22470 [Chloroflexi bacterium]|nr:hypothetical protein [Chloroflexota bacterium]
MNKTLDQMQKELEKTLKRLEEERVNVADFFKVKQIELDAKQNDLWLVIPDMREEMYN